MASKSIRAKRDAALNQQNTNLLKPQIGVKGIAALSDLKNSRMISNQRKQFTSDQVNTPVGEAASKLKSGDKMSVNKQLAPAVTTTKKPKNIKSSVKSPLNGDHKKNRSKVVKAMIEGTDETFYDKQP